MRSLTVIRVAAYRAVPGGPRDETIKAIKLFYPIRFISERRVVEVTMEAYRGIFNSATRIRTRHPCTWEIFCFRQRG